MTDCMTFLSSVLVGDEAMVQPFCLCFSKSMLFPFAWQHCVTSCCTHSIVALLFFWGEGRGHDQNLKSTPHTDGQTNGRTSQSCCADKARIDWSGDWEHWLFENGAQKAIGQNEM